MVNTMDNDFIVYDTADIMRIFHCGKNVAYNLMCSDDFPSVKVGKRMYVEHDALKEWFKGNKRVIG